MAKEQQKEVSFCSRKNINENNSYKKIWKFEHSVDEQNQKTDEYKRSFWCRMVSS